MVMMIPERPDKDEIDQVLDFDPLATVEKITGLRVGEDDSVFPLALAISSMSSRASEDVLKRNQDLYHGVSLKQMKFVLKNMGFEEVFWQPFQDNSRETDITDYHFAYWHPTKFLFFTGESYYGDHINSAQVYAYWEGNGGKGRPEHYSGGFRLVNDDAKARSEAYKDLRCQFNEATKYKYEFDEQTSEEIASQIDVSVEDINKTIEENPSINEYILQCSWHYEGMRHYLDHAESIGRFIPWPKNDRHVWFVHYADVREISDTATGIYGGGDDYNSKIEENMGLLPEHVKKAMNYHKKESQD